MGQKSDTSRTYITLYERYHFFGPSPGILACIRYVNTWSSNDSVSVVTVTPRVFIGLYFSLITWSAGSYVGDWNSRFRTSDLCRALLPALRSDFRLRVLRQRSLASNLSVGVILTTASMHCAYCETMDCRHRQCMMYSDQSSLPNCCIVHQFVLVSAPQLIEKDLMHSCADARDYDSVTTLCQPSLNC